MEVQRRFLKSSAVLFAVGMTVGVMAGQPLTVSARWFRNSVSACAGSQGTTQVDVIAQNVGTGFYSSLICPVPDTDRLRKEELDRINIHVKDSTTQNNVFARACIAYYNLDGNGSCGAVDSTTDAGTGWDTLRPSLSKFTSANASHWGYVNIGLPPAQGSNDPSKMTGYYGTD